MLKKAIRLGHSSATHSGDAAGKQGVGQAAGCGAEYMNCFRTLAVIQHVVDRVIDHCCAGADNDIAMGQGCSITGNLKVAIALKQALIQFYYREPGTFVAKISDQRREKTNHADMAVVIKRIGLCGAASCLE